MSRDKMGKINIETKLLSPWILIKTEIIVSQTFVMWQNRKNNLKKKLNFFLPKCHVIKWEINSWDKTELFLFSFYHVTNFIAWQNGTEPFEICKVEIYLPIVSVDLLRIPDYWTIWSIKLDRFNLTNFFQFSHQKTYFLEFFQNGIDSFFETNKFLALKDKLKCNFFIK